MTLDLEALAVARAEEQIEAGAWRGGEREDETAKPSPVPCAICRGEIVGRRSNARLCKTCHDGGWSATPCNGCGGPRKRTDETWVNNPERRGYCAACRAEMPQVQRGSETIAIAREALARKARAA